MIDFPKLKNLNIKENPIVNIPKAIFDKENCFQDILDYQKDLKISPKHNVDKLKLIFVGNGRTGKTSLMRVLRNEVFQDDEVSTHGIYLEEWQVGNIHFAVWDFGGQHLYHATHRLFLQTEAIVVLCWDLESENKQYAIETNTETGEKHIFNNHKLLYWLDYIKTLGKGSPIFLVQTKIEKDGHRKKMPFSYDELSEKYNIVDSFAIDSKTGRGIKYLRDELTIYAQKMIEDAPKIPNSWYAAQENILQLIAQGQKQLALPDFADICQKDGLDASSTQTVRGYLHNTGTFFYQEKLFGGNIILDQKWAIDAVYTLFNRKKLFYRLVIRNSGLFSYEDLQDNWEMYKIEEQEVFIGFMQDCEICFELGHNKRFSQKTWVAPSLLPEKPDPSVSAHFKPRKDEVLYLRMQYDFLHSGVIQSFIVRTHRLSDAQKMWRNGIWLDSDNAMAFIEADEMLNRLTIRVKGGGRKILLDKIRNELMHINSLIPEEWASLDGENYILLDTLRGNQLLGYCTENGKRHDLKDYKEFLSLDGSLRFNQLPNDNPYNKSSIVQSEQNDPFLGLKGDRLLEPDINMEYKYKKELDKSGFAFSSQDSTTFHGLPEKDLVHKKNNKMQILKKQTSDKLRILMLTANPAETTKINLDKEHARIAEKIQGKHEQFNLIVKRAIDRTEFKEFTETVMPNILHFSGHGTKNGIIVQNEDKNGHEKISIDALEALFGYFKGEGIDFNAVVLNACHSEDQALVISKHVPYVVGTTIAIGDNLAIAFSVGFYFKLDESGKNIEQAYKSGKVASQMAGAEASNFVLYKNGQKLEI